MSIHVYPTADVSPLATIGEGTCIWHEAQIRERARIGRECVIGKGVYIDTAVVIGERVKIQNYVSIYHGVEIEDGVFCGPQCVFTNDRLPRAVDPAGTLKTSDDWQVTRTVVRAGASIGANATVVCGVTIGRWAMIGAGAVVTHDVPDYGLVLGNPGRLRGFVCACGHRLQWNGSGDGVVSAICSVCARRIEIPQVVWEMAS